MNTEKLKEIMDLFSNSQVQVLEVENSDMRIRLEKPSFQQSVDTQCVTNLLANEETHNATNHQTIVSPLVGTFYTGASENSKPFVRVGERINKGDTLCIIEAMKVMNEIKSDKDGVIKDIVANNGEMVQFDEVLFLIGECND